MGSSADPVGRSCKQGARPPVVDSAEPGDWLHGWQHHASSSSEYHHRETMVSQSSDADQAHLRSHLGPRVEFPVPRIPHSGGVHSATRVVPHSSSRENEVANPGHGISL